MRTPPDIIDAEFRVIEAQDVSAESLGDDGLGSVLHPRWRGWEGFEKLVRTGLMLGAMLAWAWFVRTHLLPHH